jgi:hypothetical protein
MSANEENNINNAANENRERRSRYNPNRPCYLSADGMYYCYEVWDAESNRVITQKLEIGKDLSEEWTIFLDETDHEMDLNDRYEDEAKDSLFEKKRARYESSDSDDDEVVDPWNEITAPDQEDSQPENPDAAKVREVVENDFTPQQKNLYYDHFGAGKQMEQIRQEEAERTGKEVTPQAMDNRKKKMIRKVAKKAFGVEPVKRRRG